MRALTLKQPWAYAVTHLGKRVENRTWAPPRSIVGHDIAIHAGKSIERDSVRNLAADGYQLPERYVTGAIVAVATVTGYCTDADVMDADDEWYVGPVGWKLECVRRVRPYCCNGALGLWQTPALWVPSYE